MLSFFTSAEMVGGSLLMKLHLFGLSSHACTVSALTEVPNVASACTSAWQHKVVHSEPLQIDATGMLGDRLHHAARAWLFRNTVWLSVFFTIRALFPIFFGAL